MNKKDLWLRLKAYHFNHLVPPHLWIKVTAAFGGEDASTKTFADKIASKLEWKHRFALRAIREYKKFIYLGAVSDFVVTLPRSLARYGMNTCSSPKRIGIFAPMYSAFLLTADNFIALI